MAVPACPAQADAPDDAPAAHVYDFRIEAQSMQAALNRFSEQSGVRILFAYDAAKGLRSRRLRGRKTPRAALETLIAGTGLRLVSLRGNVAVLRLDTPDTSGTNGDGANDNANAALADAHTPLSVAMPPPEPILVTGRRLSSPATAIGEGHVSQTSAVTRRALLSAPPGISGLKMLEYLPGFNVQTDGALGLYEFGNSVQTRAFNLDQIGFVVDGIPLGRSDAFGGSPVFRYVDNENLAQVEASTGAGDLANPSYASLGPMVVYSSIVPDATPGLMMAQSFGSDELARTFLRVESGRVGPFRAYLSRTRLNSDLWRGAGSVDREHWEGQLRTDLGGGSWARFKFVSNRFFDYDSPSLTRAQYESDEADLGGKTGRARGYIGFVPVLAESVAGVPYSNAGYAYYYGNAINARDDRLYGATLHLARREDAASFLETTLYAEDKNGYGVSPDTYANSLVYYDQQAAAGLAVTAPRGLQYGYSGVWGRRRGAVVKAALELGAHRLDAGAWHESDRYARQQYRLNRADGAPDGAVLDDEVVYYRRDYHSRRTVTQFWLRDRWTPGDGPLTIEAGFKGLLADYAFSGYRDYADYALADGTPGWGPQKAHAHYADGFQPSAGLVWRFDEERTQLFASYAQTMAFPKGMDTLASTAFQSSSAFATMPRAERARNAELGLRTVQPRFYATGAVYLTRFTNLIAPISAAAPGGDGTLETQYANVGAVNARGVELTASVKPAALRDIAYFNANLTFSDARFADDMPDGTKIAGKRLPDSARWIVTGSATLEPTPWLLGNISAKYTSRRYADYINTQSVRGQLVVSAYVELGREEGLGPLRTARLRINVDNLFDTDALSFIYQTVNEEASYRPLSPRTVQVTLTGAF
ncbi:TonB-dependent receptor [Novosphingobium sp. 1949]|uniref:TonB-dependent receptor n=1 Tax=Novosphingobium organovorum TaxID=2930092 RepID=A0ABT0BDX8_9SPHN|nr:TonB-dependent receptor [Novosphingobium organovorum]